MRHRVAAAAVLAAAGLGLSAMAAGAADSRGEYLAKIMDCTGCHTPGTMVGKPDIARYLGGGDVGFAMPDIGVVYPPNLTSHETGLSAWSEEDIIKAVRTGERPDGRILAPIMPYHAYSALTDEDARELARYLKSLPPIDNDVPGPIGEGNQPPLPYMSVVAPQ